MSTPWRTTRMRDLTVMTAPDGHQVVIACDSVGGIGPKEHDTFRADARTVTHFAARVPLIELIAAGAEPVVIIDTLSVEKDPTGLIMIHEIRAMATQLGLDPDIAVTGSTEDNVTTTATALGVTVIGHADPGALTVGSARPGDHIVAIGQPLSAPAIRLTPGDPRMPTLGEVAQLKSIPGIHDVLPVGSHGIDYEIDQLVRAAGLSATVAGPMTIDRITTAGPSTCVLVAAEPAAIGVIARLRADLPIELVAVIETPSPSTLFTQK